MADAQLDPRRLLLTGADGATVECRPVIGGIEPAEDAVGALLAHVGRPRAVGVLLVRLGAHAAGVFEDERLVVSKVDRRLVHARHRKGGSSQRRFERRRGNQARESLRAAADVAARVLLPHADAVDAIVGGGDRGALEEVLADRRLAPLAAKAAEHVVDVPEPRLEVLRTMPTRFRATIVTPR